MPKFSLATLCIVTLTLLLSSCALLPSLSNDKPPSLEVSLEPQQHSPYNAVVASFTVASDKALVFRVVSNLAMTKQWLPQVSKITSLAMYDNNNFLLRTILDSPWPFDERELISCVATEFGPKTTRINITSCSERHQQSKQYVRVTQLQSSWQISQITPQQVSVTYKTWLNPNGNVPAFFFNSALKTQTKESMARLQQLIIEQTALK